MKYIKYQVGGGLGSLLDMFKDPKQLLNKAVGFANTAAPQITQTMSGESTNLSGGWGAASEMTKGLGRQARNMALNTALPGVGGIIGAGMDLAAGAIDEQECVTDKTTGEEICYDTNSKGENVAQELLSGNLIGAAGALFGKENKFDPSTLKRRNKEFVSSGAAKRTNEAANMRLQNRVATEASDFNPFGYAKKGGKFYFKNGGKWMQKVSKDIKKKGTEGKFTEYCKSKGYKKTTCKCVAEGKSSKDKTIVKRATLAGTFLNCK